MRANSVLDPKVLGSGNTEVDSGGGPAGASVRDQAFPRGRRFRRLNAERVKDALYPICTLVVVVIVWQILVPILGTPQYILPVPTTIVDAISEHQKLLIESTITTGEEALIGFAMAIVGGIPLGIAIAMSRTFSRCGYPILVAANALPKIAVAPLFVIWFGFGLTPKLLIAFLIAFFPMVIATAVGINGIDPKMIDLTRSMGLSPLSTFVKVRFPDALPSILGGFKISSQLAVIGAVAGEFVGADKGLGKLLLETNAGLETDLLFAALIYLTVFSMILFAVVQILERFAIPWHASMRNGGADGRR